MKTLRIHFTEHISFTELPYFRGAVLNAVAGSPYETLFHNHVGSTFRYRYPLIQYKRIGGKAALVCIGEGTQAIGDYFAVRQTSVMLAQRPATLEIEAMKADNIIVQLWQSEFCYSLRRWLPLNSDNYRKYTQMQGVAQRIEFLQSILVGNILSMLKSFDLRLDDTLYCIITDIDQPRLVTYKGVKMMSFDVQFTSNISLPNYIGIGKGASLGFGTLVRMKNKEE